MNKTFYAIFQVKNVIVFCELFMYNEIKKAKSIFLNI